jgi:hypothetical protein
MADYNPNPNHPLLKYFDSAYGKVTRAEYDELFLAMTRLTDRIEALEKRHPEPGAWHAHRDLPVEDDDDTYSS